MLGAWVDWDKLAQVMFLPRIPTGPLARYVVRAEPGRRDALMAEIEQSSPSPNPTRVITWVRAARLLHQSAATARQRMVASPQRAIVLLVIR